MSHQSYELVEPVKESTKMLTCGIVDCGLFPHNMDHCLQHVCGLFVCGPSKILIFAGQKVACRCGEPVVADELHVKDVCNRLYRQVWSETMIQCHTCHGEMRRQELDKHHCSETTTTTTTSNYTRSSPFSASFSAAATAASSSLSPVPSTNKAADVGEEARMRAALGKFLPQTAAETKSENTITTTPSIGTRRAGTTTVYPKTPRRGVRVFGNLQVAHIAPTTTTTSVVQPTSILKPASTATPKQKLKQAVPQPTASQKKNKSAKKTTSSSSSTPVVAATAAVTKQPAASSSSASSANKKNKKRKQPSPPPPPAVEEDVDDTADVPSEKKQRRSVRSHDKAFVTDETKIALLQFAGLSPEERRRKVWEAGCSFVDRNNGRTTSEPGKPPLFRDAYRVSRKATGSAIYHKRDLLNWPTARSCRLSSDPAVQAQELPWVKTADDLPLTDEEKNLFAIMRRSAPY